MSNPMVADMGQQIAEREAMLASMPKAQADQQQANEALVAQAKRDGLQGNLRVGEGGNMVLMDDWAMGSKCEKYEWGQNEQEILIRVRVPAGTKSKAVSFDVSSAKLKLQVLGDPILTGELYRKVKPDDSTFTLEDAPVGTSS